nr:Gfo/Idh/MocA family oxidoreductase [Pirellulaceae bacterium]
MTETIKQVSSRRQFLETTGRIAAATTLAGMAVPHVHAAEDNTLQLVLVGCGGRGTGAAANALAVKQGPMRLIAMVDVFPNRLQGSLGNLKNQFGDRVDVPEDRQFIGFDGYRKAIDCLKPGDIVISATPPAFRWAHFEYAIKKGMHIFMEKPLTTDGPTSRRMLATAAEAKAKNLKTGVGLMSRHSRALQELHQRIQDG